MLGYLRKYIELHRFICIYTKSISRQHHRCVDNAGQKTQPPPTYSQEDTTLILTAINTGKNLRGGSLRRPQPSSDFAAGQGQGQQGGQGGAGAPGSQPSQQSMPGSAPGKAPSSMKPVMRGVANVHPYARPWPQPSRSGIGLVIGCELLLSSARLHCWRQCYAETWTCHCCQRKVVSLLQQFTTSNSCCCKSANLLLSYSMYGVNLLYHKISDFFLLLSQICRIWLRLYCL